MGFFNIKPWHIGIGLPIFSGVLLFSYLQIEPRPNPRTTSPVMFENVATGRPVGRSNPQPVVQDVRVYPPVDGLYTVNFVQLVADPKEDRWLKQEWSFTAKHPRNNSNETIIEWFDRLKEQNPSFTYTYEWWREPGKVWPIWAGSSAVLFAWGVLLPLVIWLVKGGPGRLKAEMKAVPKSTASAASPVVTAADRDQLDDMIDRLETSTHTDADGNPVPSGTPASNPAAANAPKILSGKPLEALPDAGKHEEDKEYKGEFYPVAKSGTHKKDGH
jgi:hypothetical protein